MVPLEEFIRIWQASNSVHEVAEMVGTKIQAVYQRAYHLRQKGVPLKVFVYRRSGIDYAALAVLAKSLEEKQT